MLVSVSPFSRTQLRFDQNVDKETLLRKSNSSSFFYGQILIAHLTRVTQVIPPTDNTQSKFGAVRPGIALHIRIDIDWPSQDSMYPLARHCNCTVCGFVCTLGDIPKSRETFQAENAEERESGRDLHHRTTC